MNLILLLLAFLLYIFKPSWLMSLWLITIPLIAPFLVLRAGIDDLEEVQEFLWPLWSTYNRFFVIIILYRLIFKKERFSQRISYFMYPWLALCIFLFFHNIITQFDLSVIYQNSVGALYAVSPMALFLLDKRTRPSLKQIYATTIIILLVQLVWLPLNMEGVFAYMSRYQEIVLNVIVILKVADLFIIFFKKMGIIVYHIV